MVIISFKKVPIRNNSELFSISYLYCYFNIRYRNVHLTALFFYPMPLSEIPYFKAFPVVSFILLYWNCIGGKANLIAAVEFIHRFDQPDGSDLKQIFRFHTSVLKSANDTPDKPDILFHQYVPRLLIPFVCSLYQSEGTLHRASFYANGCCVCPIVFFIRTIVPTPTSDSTST